MGRRLTLTPDIEKKIVEVITATGSDKDAYTLAGVPDSTFYRWMELAEKQRAGIYRDFRDKVEKARAARKVQLVASIRKAGQDAKHWTANAWLLERTEAKEYGQRVRFHIEEELTDAIERLKRAFASEPELLERALSALVEDNRGGDSERDSIGEEGEDDSDDETVLPTPPKPKAGGVPPSGR